MIKASLSSIRVSFSLQVSGVRGPSALVTVEVGQGLARATVTTPSVMWKRRAATPSHAPLSQLWKVGGDQEREGGLGGGGTRRGGEKRA